MVVAAVSTMGGAVCSYSSDTGFSVKTFSLAVTEDTGSWVGGIELSATL